MSPHPLPARERLAFPLDVPSLAEARGWVERLQPEVGLFKVGLELFCAEGQQAVRAVVDAGAACFLDLKLHDIPSTMAGAASVAARLGARYLTVHASAGVAALEQTRKAIEGSNTQLLAVTALTSLGEDDLGRMGLGTPTSAVETLGAIAADAGLNGFVCSPHEARLLRARFPNATLVTPGVRLGGDAHGQKRVTTPQAAIEAGSDVLVVGRPIRLAERPKAVAQAIVRTLSAS